MRRRTWLKWAGSLALLWATPGLATETQPQVARKLRPTVAVLYFGFGGGDAELEVLRKGLAQMLISDLAAVPSVDVVERERLQAVLDEQKLGKVLKLDPATSARVGKLLGARYLVLGDYFGLGKALRADARLVDVETGKILGSLGANGPADDFLGVEQKLAEGLTKLVEVLPTPPATQPPSPQPKPPPRPKPPARLVVKTAVQYAKALDLKDKGKKAEAAAQMKEVVQAQPDFELAQRDLAALLR